MTKMFTKMKISLAYDIFAIAVTPITIFMLTMDKVNQQNRPTIDFCHVEMF